MKRPREIALERGWFSSRIRVYPYRAGIGMSISVWPGTKRPQVSIYLGPFKFWLGISGKRASAWIVRKRRG